MVANSHLHLKTYARHNTYLSKTEDTNIEMLQLEHHWGIINI